MLTHERWVQSKGILRNSLFLSLDSECYRFYYKRFFTKFNLYSLEETLLNFWWRKPSSSKGCLNWGTCECERTSYGGLTGIFMSSSEASMNIRSTLRMKSVRLNTEASTSTSVLKVTMSEKSTCIIVTLYARHLLFLLHIECSRCLTETCCLFDYIPPSLGYVVSMSTGHLSALATTQKNFTHEVSLTWVR